VRDVVAPGHGIPSEATVECAVSEMAGEIHPSGSSAVLTLRFRVFSNSDGPRRAEEILLKSYSSTLPISPASAEEVARGWNRGLSDIMAEFQADLRASLIAASLLSPDSDRMTGPGRPSARK